MLRLFSFSSITIHPLAKNTLLHYTASFVNGFSLFMVNVLLARFFSEDNFALFSLATLTLVSIAEMSDFGLNGGLARFVPFYLKQGENRKMRQLLRMVWSWRVWMVSILTLGGIVGSEIISIHVFGQPLLSPYLRVSFLGLGGIIFLGFVSTFLKASEHFSHDAIIQILKGILRISGVLLLMFFNISNLWWYLSVYVVVPWILFLFSYRFLPRNFVSVEMDSGDREMLKKQIGKFSFWLTIWSFSAIIASRIDQVLLSNMLSLRDVAIYTAAFQFVFMYSLGLQSLSAVLMPKFSGIKNKHDLKSLIWKLYKYIPLVSVLIVVGIYLSQFLFPLIFGNRYIDSVPLYLILSYAMVISFFTIPFSSLMHIFNKTHLVAISGALQLVITVGLNLYFIPMYGVYGAAYSFVGSTLFSNLFMVIAGVCLIKCAEIEVL